MKKTAAVLLALILAISLFACSGGEGVTTAAETQNGAETKTDVTSPSQNHETSAETNEEAPGTEPEPVKGNEDLEVSEKLDYVMIAGMGGCTEKDVVIPSHINGKPVTVIDEDAFCESDITSIVIPWTVRKIDEDAFVDCKNLVSVTLSEGLESISNSAFYGCTALKSITLPASLRGVSSYAFRGCISLEEVVILGDTRLENGIFQDCTSLKSITVKSPGNETYPYGSSICPQESLQTLVLSEGLTKIGSWAFADTPELKEVYLPKSLTEIDSCAFLRSGITKVYYAGSEDEWKAINVKSSNEPLSDAEIVYNYK